jgi:hypothetical protein
MLRSSLVSLVLERKHKKKQTDTYKDKDINQKKVGGQTKRYHCNLHSTKKRKEKTFISFSTD